MKKLLIALSIILLLTPFSLAASLEQRQEYRACSSDCKDIRKDSQNICKSDYSECKDASKDRQYKVTCARERVSCMKQATTDYRECRDDCRKILIPKCEFSGEVYQAGDEFENGCEICECKRNGKVRCKQEPFCNEDSEITQEQCELSNGLYQALCRGGNFHLYCNREKYCICGGNNEFSCPNEYECLYDFRPPRANTNPLWVDLRGSPLGKIGICVK